jgi:hypothetical protein
MHAETPSSTISTGLVWTGRVLSALAVLFLLFDGAMKLVQPSFVVEANAELGYPENTLMPLGVVLIVCTLLYAIPPTAVLGAIFLTGYLGGAVATHVRAGHPAFQTLFPVIFGAIIWGGLVLRDARLRSVVPWRS